MTELFIPYELAILAKEKGYNEYFTLGQATSLYTKHGKLTNYMNYGFMYSGLSDGYISAPLYWQVIQWLREEHKIFVAQTPLVGWVIWYDSELRSNNFLSLDEVLETALKMI